MPKKQKDKPPEMYDGGGSHNWTPKELLRQKYSDLQDKYDLHRESQHLILSIRIAKIKLNKNYPSISDYVVRTLQWLVGDNTPSKKYIKLQRLNNLIYIATIRSNRRKYSYDVLAKLLME